MPADYGGPDDGIGIIQIAYKLVQIIDDLGRAIDLTYDNFGQLISVEDPLGRLWTYSYSSEGELIEQERRQQLIIHQAFLLNLLIIALMI